MKKRIIYWMMAFCLILIVPSTSVQAASVLTSGTCGAINNVGGEASVTWELDSDGVLTISGTGKMADWRNYDVPWKNEKEKIEKVRILDGVTSIGINAFYNCNAITSIDVPESIISIGDYAFGFCYNLTNASIPSSVSSIGNGLFYACSSLSSVNIPSTVYNIGDYMFHGCSSLTSINIPNGITKIGDSAFSGCWELESISLPTSVTSIGGQAFSQCSKLTNIIIPNGVTSIGGSAFELCSNLSNITIPNSVTSIGSSAFYSCSSLNSVIVPNSVEEMGVYAFRDCLGLTSISLSNRISEIKFGTFEGCCSLSSIIIPNSVTSIGDNAFWYCTDLTNITIPEGVTGIGECAFSGCSKLMAIEVKGNNNSYDSKDGVLFNKDQTSLLCYPGGKAGTYEIPEGVTYLSDGAFAGCSGLISVSIPDGVSSIGAVTFQSCSSLISVTIPDSITTIGNSAFYECSSLRDVYYLGSEDSWSTIVISDANDSLLNSNIHYTPISYTVTVNGGIANRYIATRGTTITITAIVPSSGEIFDRWIGSEGVSLSNAKESTTSFKMPGKNVTVTASFKAASYTVTFDLNASDASVSPTSKSVTNGGTYGDLPTATRPNYSFDGWFTSASGGTQVSSSTTVNLSANQMLYAHWTYSPASYTVTFNANASDASVSSTSKSVTNGGTYGNLPTATRSNYRFDGWFTSASGGTQVTSSTTVNLTGNQTLYAHWTREETNITPSLASLSYAFQNSYEGFGYPNPYYIPFARYSLIFGNTVKAKTLHKLQYIEDGDWGGSCYGMSATTSMFYQQENGIVTSSFNSSALTPYSLTIGDRNSSLNLTLTEFIEAMQVSQYADKIQQDYDQNTDLENLVRAVNSFAQTGKNPVIIAVMRQMGQQKNGHALVGYKVERVNASTSKLYVYDCNYPNTERTITLSTNSSGAYTGWYYHLNDRYDWGSAYKGCSISYIPYSDFNQIWVKRGKENSLCTFTVNSDVLIRDMDGNSVASIEDGELFTGRDDILPVVHFGLMANGEFPTHQTTSILLPADLYTVERLSGSGVALQSIEPFEATMLHVEQAASITTTAGKITFAVDDESGINYVGIDGDESGSTYDVTLNSTLAGDHEEVQLTGTVLNKAMALTQINGSLNINGAGSGAKLMVDGNEVSLGGVSNDVLPVMSFVANGGIGTMSPRTANESNEVVLPVCSFAPPEGYLFRAWQVNGEEFIPGEICTINENTAATALWTPTSNMPYVVQSVSREGSVVKVNIKNQSGSGALLIAASYDVSGRMLNCATHEITIPIGMSNSVTLTLGQIDHAEVRVFLVDRLTYQPLCESRTIN